MAQEGAAIVKGLVRVVLVLVLVLVPSVARAETPSRPNIRFAEAYRACSLVRNVDVPHGGKLTAKGKEAINGCMVLGTAYEDGDRTDDDGKPIPRNYSLALDYYKTACVSGEAFGCVSAGQLFEKGLVSLPKGKGTVDTYAFVYYTTGCYMASGDSESVALSCEMAAVNAFQTPDKKKGKAKWKGVATSLKLYQKACELGRDDSCKLVAKIMEVAQ